MRSAQFVKGKIFDSEKQDSYEQTFESPTLETFLPYEKLAKLRSIKIITDQPQQRYFRTEHVFALTTIKESDHVDTAGRTGLVNHTFLVEVAPSTRHNGFPYKLDEELFLEEVLADKWRLKMPPFPTLKKPLDVPIIEWEVCP
ncbi:MAG: hypothetical protein WC325_10645 [Candidatus Bathyarchaeia archaeon]